MSTRDWQEYQARITLAEIAQPPQVTAAPEFDDPLATTIRAVIQSRKARIPEDRIAELLLERGAGITVEEQALPDTVRTRVLSLEEMAAREQEEETAMWLERATR